MKESLIPAKFSEAGCIGFDGENLYVSVNNEYHDFDRLRNTAKAFYESNHDGHFMIAVADITEICFHEDQKNFYLRYKKPSGKIKKFAFTVKDKNTRIEFCTTLARTSGLKLAKEYTSALTGLWGNLITIVIVLLLTWVMCRIAASETTYGNRVLARAMGDLLRSLGPLPVAIAGIAVALFFVWRIVKNVTQPTKTLIYQ